MSGILEFKDNLEILEEVRKLCLYLSDTQVKEVQTHHANVAEVFTTLGYNVNETGRGVYTIRRFTRIVEDDGYWF